MERNLKFLKTMSVAEFKAQHNVEKIEVKRNEHTGKCFFVYGFETGPCREWRTDNTSHFRSMLC